MLQKQSAPIDEIIDQYLKAIKITLVDFDGKNINDMLLSSVEACIVFEYAILKEQQDAVNGLAIYTQLIRYFNKPDIEIGIKCRILPKLIYNMCQIWLKDKKYLPILNLCNIGIECLRVNQKFYYFTKLLELKIEVIEKSQLGNEDYEQVKEWYDVLMGLYEEYQLNPSDDNIVYMQNFLWQNYDAIGDVIRKRRKMFGMTQAQLCEGICDIKTISRMERLQGNPQLEIVEQLLQRLNLSGQLYSDGVVTNDYETFALAREITDEMSKNNFDEARTLLEKLKVKLDLNNKINLQYVQHKEIIIANQLNEITLNETLDMYMETLELTINKEMLFNKKEKYLTKKEIILINNIVNYYDKLNATEECLNWIKLIENYYNYSINNNLTNGTSYIFSIRNISSILGNQNLFDKSDVLFVKLLKYLLITDNCNNICRVLYDLSWNYFEKNKLNKDMEINKKIIYMNLIKKSYILSNLQNDKYLKNLIKSKKIF